MRLNASLRLAACVGALGLAACTSNPPQPSTPAPAPLASAPAAPPVRIGIALGGGAAKGFAHIGVIKMLEANGFTPWWSAAPAPAAWWARCMPAA
jgi:NTE family protein